MPAAHYTCGGVVTDLDGRTDLPGLYAVGETAYTGLHGANRLASNSLLECVVFGTQLRRTHPAGAARRPQPRARLGRKPGRPTPTSRSSSRTTGTNCADSCGTMSASCAPPSGWNARCTASSCCKSEIDEYYANFRVTRDLLELRNLVVNAELIVRSALMRHESRGLHFSRDFPQTLPVSFPTVLTRRARSRQLEGGPRKEGRANA